MNRNWSHSLKIYFFRKQASTKIKLLSWGGGQVVSMFAFYSDDLSLNPTEVYNFIVLERTKNKQKEAGIIHI